MCLAQGPQRSDAGETRTRVPSRVKHSTTELPLCGHFCSSNGRHYVVIFVVVMGGTMGSFVLVMGSTLGHFCSSYGRHYGVIFVAVMGFTMGSFSR